LLDFSFARHQQLLTRSKCFRDSRWLQYGYFRALKEVDFSSFVFVESTGVLVRKASDIRSVADMGGTKIAAISGTTNEQAITKQFKQKSINATVIEVKSRDEGV
jgi:ABC-type amino acid transport substrate-binding protein